MIDIGFGIEDIAGFTMIKTRFWQLFCRFDKSAEFNSSEDYWYLRVFNRIDIQCKKGVGWVLRWWTEPADRNIIGSYHTAVPIIWRVKEGMEHFWPSPTATTAKYMIVQGANVYHTSSAYCCYNLVNAFDLMDGACAMRYSIYKDGHKIERSDLKVPY